MALFSIIIAVYNDWSALGPCLQSLSRLVSGTDFEVIVIDDGSLELAPEEIRQFEERLKLTISRQPHAGISTARNHGIRVSKGSILLFMDADCRLQPDCLAELASTASSLPVHSCFQLRIVGDCRGIVGRAEELRLLTLQNHLLQPDGRIRYLNTSGFAIRRSHIDTDNGLFDIAVFRAEDTLLLANLLERGELPFFATTAVVRHDIRLSVFGCFRKDVRSALLEGPTFELIARKGIRIRMSNRERLGLLRSMWDISKQPSIGRGAWLLLAVRQSLQRITSLVYAAFSSQPVSGTRDLTSESHP